MNRWMYVFKLPELRSKIIAVLGLLVAYRVLASIPVPGVDVETIRQFTEGNQLFQLFDLFSGGGFSSFSIVMLGVGPYITASIVMQLFTVILPPLKALYKEEGEQGRQKFNQYTRLLTVPLGIFQSISMITLFRSQGLIQELSRLEIITAITVITAGTVLLMWIGELITDKNVGNGISLIIFAGIIASFPGFVNQFRINFQQSELPTYALYAVISAAIIYAIIFVTEGQRNIPISYSKQARTVSMVKTRVDTYLPLKVNQAGVIPIIFAVTLMIFPQVIFQFGAQSGISWLVPISTSLLLLWSNQVFYAIAYFVLVFAFTYFYTSIVFEPQSIADNLQRQGGFITGIRPGQKTADYLSYVSTRIILFGALFLSTIAVLPFIMTGFTGDQSLAIGGTSLLIVVSVVLETMKQIDSQIIVRDYENL